MHLWGVPPHAPNMQIWGQYAREARHFMSRPPLQGATCQCLGFNAQEVKLGVWDVFDVLLLSLYITK